MGSDAPKPLHLSVVVRNYLAKCDDVSRIGKLVPLAWPVLQVQHVLRVQVEETLGVVERYALEALARFGPMDNDSLANLLGLEAVVVSTVIDQLWRFAGTLCKDGPMLSVAEGTLARLALGAWTLTAEQPFAFSVDAVVDTLLPLDVDRVPRSYWLRVDVADREVVVRDVTGRPLHHTGWLAGQCIDGGCALRQLLTLRDPSARRAARIPEGAQSVVDNTAKILREGWLLALALVETDGRVRVTLASHPEAVLWEGGAALGDYARASRVGWRAPSLRWHEPSDGVNADGTNGSTPAPRELPAPWADHGVFDRRSNRLTVRLRAPGEIPPWPQNHERADGAQPEDETPPDGPRPLPNSLRLALDRDVHWNHTSHDVLLVEPGDEATAQVQLLLGGLQEIRRLAANGVEDGWKLAVWWNERQSRRAAHWQSPMRSARVPLAAFISAARRCPESDVVEFLSDHA